MGPPHEEREREAASVSDAEMFSVWLMLVAVGKATSDGSVKAMRLLMVLGVEIRLQEFMAIWLGADIILQSIGEMVLYLATCRS